MRISATGISSNRSGFTLLELLVVLVILSAAAAVTLPRLSALSDRDSRTTARSIATLLRYLDERAVTSRTPYRLVVDLNEQSIQVQQRTASGEYVPPDDPFLNRNPLQGTARLVDLHTDRTGTITSGSCSLPYGAGGISEALVLHLEVPGRTQYTVQALPVNGSVKVAEGRLEIIR